MKKILLLLLFTYPLSATKAMIVAACEKYMHMLPTSLEVIRNVHNCQLPIQVWYSGGELSQFSKEKLSLYAPIEFCDITKEYQGSEKEYQGYQIKGLMLAKTRFDEVLLFDADVFFHQNPEIVFSFREYQETGAYVFHDRVHPDFFYYAETKGVFRYLQRRDFFLNLIKEPSEFVPPTWRHYWDLEFLPKKQNPVNSEHMESGFMAIDKKRHKKGIEFIEKLNLNFRVSYAYVLGDKETYWLGFEMAHEPYYVNREFPKILLGDDDEVGTVQFVNEKLFYQQKAPIPLGEAPYFRNTEDYSKMRKLNEEERSLLSQLYFIHQCVLQEFTQ